MMSSLQLYILLLSIILLHNLLYVQTHAVTVLLIINM
jgi:hypothetical protein